MLMFQTLMCQVITMFSDFRRECSVKLLCISVIYSISKDFGLDFQAMFCCVGLWNSFFLFLYSAFDLSVVMRWSTRWVTGALMFPKPVDGCFSSCHMFLYSITLEHRYTWYKHVSLHLAELSNAPKIVTHDVCFIS